YFALSTRISCARMVSSTALRNDATSKSPAPSWNLRRFSDARLQAESSRNMYSLQGLLALMRSVVAEVCQSLIVESNCSPGSPHWCAASAIERHTSLARSVSTTAPERTARVCHARSRITASMNSSVTRTELFEFWKNTDAYASPVNAPS